MGLKDILVRLDPTEVGERRLRLAAAIAHGHQAHLSAAYILSEAMPGVPPYEGAGLPGAPPIVPAAVSPGAELADIVEQALPCGGASH